MDFQKIFNTLFLRVKKVNFKQWGGFILFIIGVYLSASSIWTIWQLCGKCEESGSGLGWLSFINPVLGLASLAEHETSHFRNIVLIPLIAGILLMIWGIVMIISKRREGP